MVRRKSNRSNWGIGLAEALTAMMVLSIVGGTLVAIYQASLRTYARGATENYAQQSATSAVQRMAPDIRQGLSVTPGGAPFTSCYVAIRLPERPFDGGTGRHLNQVTTDVNGVPYLVRGDWAVYYRGDADGSISQTGDRIWRTVLDADGATTLKQDVVAEHVVDNPVDATGSPAPLFRYWPDIYRLKSVEIAVTVRERGSDHFAAKVASQSTIHGEFTLRNR